MDIRHLNWSKTEKAIAQKAFNLALDREFEEVIQEAKGRAAKLAEPDDLWSLERFLTRRRKEIDRRYDYRYSELPFVFGCLIREGRLSLEDLRGLGEDKLDYVRRLISV